MSDFQTFLYIQPVDEIGWKLTAGTARYVVVSYMAVFGKVIQAVSNLDNAMVIVKDKEGAISPKNCMILPYGFAAS